MSDNRNLNYLSKLLFKAVWKNEDINKIESLLNQGASPLWMEYGWTVLHWAAKIGNLQYLELFLTYEVNVNVKDNRSTTPLHDAAWSGNIECCKLLLNKGAIENVTDNFGCTSLHYAARSGNVECCEFFINNGTIVNVLDNYGNTPLHDAAKYVAFECCQLLVENHADINIKNNNGETPLPYLLCYPYLSNEYLKIFKYFYESGAILQPLPKSWNDIYLTNNYNSIETCWKWWKKQQIIGQELIDIPSEIFERGSEAINIYFNEIYSSQNRIYRSRICVVGPSNWGKTSLIKSLISSSPTRVQEDVRTIGIDQFQWRFEFVKENTDLRNANTSDLNILDDGGNKEKHQVSFWDFAGQDVYKGAHSIYFSSSRTLFFICVNLQLYSEDIKNKWNNTSDEILRWIRLIFAKQPSAKLLFVGTKADLVNSSTVQNIKADLSECVQDWCDKYSEDINSRQALLSEYSTPSHDLQIHLANLANEVSSKWVITSSQDEYILNDACNEIQRHIRDRNIGFVMPDSYIKVLDYMYKLRNDAASPNILSTENGSSNSDELIEHDHGNQQNLQLDTIFCSQQRLKQAIRENVHVDFDNDLQNDVGSRGTNFSILNEILGLFHDLGEILQFNNITLNKKKGVIIVDPGLMIDLVRDIVRHDLYQYLEQSNTQTRLQLSEWKEHLKNGVVCHTILGFLPLWSKLTSGQKQVAKELLHGCQILHPVQDTKFGSETNIAVPALWFKNQDRTSSPPTMDQAIARRYGNMLVESRMIWEYEFSPNTLPESFFEFFVVKSYDYKLEQIVLPNSLEVWMTDISSLCLVTFSLSVADHHIIKIEVASHTQELGVQLLQYVLTAVENLLFEYPGISKTPYIVELITHVSQMRQVVNSRFILRRFCSTANYDWLDENLFLWYFKLFSVDQTDLPELLHLCEQKKQLQRHNRDEERRNMINQNLQQINTGLSNLSIMDASQHEILQSLLKGEKIRKLPALWTAELKENGQKLYLRLLSDISGRCFHEPIQVVNPLRLLSTYANKLKIGENLLAIVPPNAIPWKHLDVSNVREIPKTVYNLMHGCNFRSYGIVETEQTCHMHPEESESFLIHLLEFSYPEFTLDQIPLISGLVCWVSSRSGHQLWAREDEIAAFGDAITRSDSERAIVSL